MAVDTDLKTYKSETVSDDDSNGGHMSNNLVQSGVPQNVWPNAPKSERDSGSTKYRFLYETVTTDDNTPVSDPILYLDLPTAGQDWVIMFIGTQGMTQGDIVGNERKYGTAYIKADVASTDSTVTVTVEDESLTTGDDQLFKVGDSCFITSKPLPTSSVGDTVEFTIQSVSASGKDVTIVATTAFGAAFTTSDAARVASTYKGLTELKAEVDTLTVSSGTGAYDSATYPVALNNQSTITDTVTLTFTDANNYTVNSTRKGVLASGNITTNYAPINSNTGNPYFTLDYQGFSGTFAALDTITIPLTSASICRVEKRVIPPLCGSLSGNSVTSAWRAESE